MIWLKFCLLDPAIYLLLLSHPICVSGGNRNGSVLVTRMRDGRLGLDLFYHVQDKINKLSQSLTVSPRAMTPLLSLLTFLFLSLQGTYALWPQPTNLKTGTSALRLAPNTTFKITVDVTNPPDDLLAAVQRTRTYLFTDNLARLVPSHGAEDLPALSHAKALPGLTLRLQSQGEGDEGYEAVSREIALEAQTYIFLRQEEYTLNVPADGTEAVLSAASTLGLFRGLNTFAGLWYTYDYGKEALDQDGKNRDGNVVVYTLSAPVAIQDSPAYVSLFRVFLFFHWGC